MDGGVGAVIRGEMAAPRVEIEYCPRCHWLPRAAWLAQELLTTFERDLGEVALVPATEGGRFEVRLEGAVVYSRAEDPFPEPKLVKQRIRDRLAPGRSLGHSEGKPS
jgi:selenoprotein W-related protein